MKIFLAFLFLSLIGLPAQAGSWGIIGGTNGTQVKNDSTSTFTEDFKPGMGFQFGMHYSHRFEYFRLRTLAQFRTQRSKTDLPQGKFQVYNLQFALPVLFEQMFIETFGYFIGPEFATNLKSEVKRFGLQIPWEKEAFTTNAMAGLTFRLSRKLYINAYYSRGLTEVAQEMTAEQVGLQFVTYFERQKKRYR